MLAQFGGRLSGREAAGLHRGGRRARRGALRPAGCRVHLHAARQRRAQRLRAARRLRLHHPRAAGAGRERGRGRGRARPRDRPRHRAPYRAAADPGDRRRTARHARHDRRRDLRRRGRRSPRPAGRGRRRPSLARQLLARSGVPGRHAGRRIHERRRLRSAGDGDLPREARCPVGARARDRRRRRSGSELVRDPPAHARPRAARDRRGRGRHRRRGPGRPRRLSRPHRGPDLGREPEPGRGARPALHPSRARLHLRGAAGLPAAEPAAGGGRQGPGRSPADLHRRRSRGRRTRRTSSQGPGCSRSRRCSMPRSAGHATSQTFRANGLPAAVVERVDPAGRRAGRRRARRDRHGRGRLPVHLPQPRQHEPRRGARLPGDGRELPRAERRGARPASSPGGSPSSRSSRGRARSSSRGAWRSSRRRCAASRSSTRSPCRTASRPARRSSSWSRSRPRRPALSASAWRRSRARRRTTASSCPSSWSRAARGGPTAGAGSPASSRHSRCAGRGRRARA